MSVPFGIPKQPWLAVAALTLLATSPVRSEEWSGTLADETLSFDDNEDASGVQLHLTFGRLHALWSEDALGVREVHYGFADPPWNTWSSSTSDRQISFSDGNSVFENPEAASGLERMVVVWSEEHLVGREVHYGISDDYGTSFSSESTDLLLSDPSSPGDADVPSIVMRSDEVIHVVWTQGSEAAAEVMYSRSTDGGITWSGSSGDRVISFPDGNAASSAKVLAVASQRLLVVWQENGAAGSPVVHVGISDDGGDTWSSELADHEVSVPVPWMTDFDAIFVGWYPQGGASVVFAASFDVASPLHYEIYETHTTNNGNTWTGQIALTQISFDEDHSRSARNPATFYTGCQNQVVVWDELEENSGTNEIHLSRFAGVWTGATADRIVSFPDGKDGSRPSIAGLHEVSLPQFSGEEGDTPDTWIAWTEFVGDDVDNTEVHLSSSNVCFGSSVPDALANEEPLRIHLFPNPTRNQLHVSLSSAPTRGNLRLEIVDAGGRVLRSAVETMDANGRVELDWNLVEGNARALPGGVYMVRARAGSRVIARPFVVR